MDDMSNSNINQYWEEAIEIINEAKGVNPVVMDVRNSSSFADFMIVVSASSNTHMKGIYARLKEHFKENNEVGLRNHRGDRGDTNWLLMDCGALVIQLLTKEGREFYDLEGIWFESEYVYQGSDSEESEA